MKILIASHNLGKIDRFKSLLTPFDDITVVSLEDEKIVDKVHEPFDTSRENAIHKAREYAKLSGCITIAIDDAAHTNFLPHDEQPGVYLRRFSKDRRELNDRQIIALWKEIFTKYPKKDKHFIWQSSIACFNPQNNALIVVPIDVVSYVVNFSSIIAPGYPMGSFLSPLPGGKPYSEFTEKEKRDRDDQVYVGFVRDFRAWLSKF